MINIEENYKLVQDLLSKNNGVRLTPPEYSRYASLASNDYFDTLVGSKTNNKTVYGYNRTLDKRLEIFRKREQVDIINGQCNQPTDLEFIRSMYYTYKGKIIPIKPVDEDRFAKIFSDPHAKPTNDNPIYIEDNRTIRVFPVNIKQVSLEYLRRPATPKYGFTIKDRRPVYDPSSSVHIDWDKRQEQEITMRILQFVAVSIDKGHIVQYTEAKQDKE